MPILEADPLEAAPGCSCIYCKEHFYEGFTQATDTGWEARFQN